MSGYGHVMYALKHSNKTLGQVICRTCEVSLFRNIENLKTMFFFKQIKKQISFKKLDSYKLLIVILLIISKAHLLILKSIFTINNLFNIIGYKQFIQYHWLNTEAKE